MRGEIESPPLYTTEQVWCVHIANITDNLWPKISYLLLLFIISVKYVEKNAKDNEFTNEIQI